MTFTSIGRQHKCTGQTVERIRDDSERDRFFDAAQAVKYGICDEILGEEAVVPGGDKTAGSDKTAGDKTAGGDKPK